jgi:leucyl-tRNA synthetase
MLGPITPHLAEEGWKKTQKKKSLLCEEPWPKYDKNLIKESEILLPVQVNGKKRAEIKIAVGLGSDDVKILVLELPEIKNITQDKKIKKIIVVPGRIINIVF